MYNPDSLTKIFIKALETESRCNSNFIALVAMEAIIMTIAGDPSYDKVGSTATLSFQLTSPKIDSWSR